MTKEELILLLKEYKENIAKLKLRKKEKIKYQKRLKQYKRLESNLSSTLGVNMNIHSKNTISDKTEKTALDTIEINEKEIQEAEEKIKELTTIIEELEDKVSETNIRLSALKYREKEILYAYYIEGRTYEDIGNRLYFKLFNQTRDKDTIKNIIEKATEKMVNL